MITKKMIIGIASACAVFAACLIAIMGSMYTDSVRAAPTNLPFSLVDDQGRKVDQSIFVGHPSIVYFGYTHCPEICPTTLLEVADWLNTLGDDGKPLRAYFFSIDPERDTQSVMHNYVTAFSDRITGVTGDPEEVKKATSNWMIHARKLPSDSGNYHMDHTISLLLIGADGRLKGLIPYGTSREEALKNIRATLLKKAAADQAV